VTPSPSVSSSPVPRASAAGSTAPSASVPVELDPSPVEVLDSGFTTTADPEGGSTSYGALLRNPNASWAAVRMEVHVDFLGADGSFVAGEEPVVTILPGQTTAIGGLAAGAEAAASIEVTAPDDIVAFQPRADEGTFVVEDIQTTSGDGQTTTTGRLVSRFQTDQSFVEVVAIYRDGAGSIVGGASGGVEGVPAGGSAEFEIVEFTPAVEINTTEVYWQVTR